MAKKIFRATVCTFSKELRQRQIIRGLGFTAVATLVITAHLQQNGTLHPHFVQPNNSINAVSNQTSILTDYAPQTVAAVSSVNANNSVKLAQNLPANWSMESISLQGHNAFNHLAYQAGLTSAEIKGLNTIFADTVNFKRLHPGDQFKVITERIAGSPSQKPRDKIIAAEFISGHTHLTALRYQNPKTQEVAYYQENGISLPSPFLRAPTHYTRIGSTFLWHRLDPVTGAYHSHPGVDFDAPMNTPIIATAPGTIHFMAYQHGYGNVVKINHLGQIATLYAHMNHFASHLHKGSVVKKGEVIGYVGMSGYATGPHVHYELHMGGHPVNPLTTKLPTTDNMIPANQKAKFMQQAKAIASIFARS